MTYLRSLFLNFLIVFFVLRIIPGIKIEFYENVPNIGADLLASIIIGGLNSLIIPALILFNIKATNIKIAVIGFFICLLSFLILAGFNIGIEVTAIGVILGTIIVWIVSFFTNYLELKHIYSQKK